MEDSMIERVALALEPKCRAFGGGEMPMAVAREFARAAIEAMAPPLRSGVSCPFDSETPPDLELDDPCPVCGSLGTHDSDDLCPFPHRSLAALSPAEATEHP